MMSVVEDIAAEQTIRYVSWFEGSCQSVGTYKNAWLLFRLNLIKDMAPFSRTGSPAMATHPHQKSS